MPEETELLRTALHDAHIAAGATMGPVAGWQMPQSYGDAVAECRRARARAAVFDVSHVGRVRIRGDGALDALEYLCTADVATQEDDTALFTLLCDGNGGILDQCLLIRTSAFWVLTCSPQCRRKVLDHLAAHAGRFDLKVDDQTPLTSQVLVAGPEAPRLLDAVLPMRVSALPAGAARTGSLLVARYIALRTAITGEWGLEVMLPNMVAARAWRFVTRKAGDNAIDPAGQDAWDTLRIEAGSCRYGRELDETIDPVTAGLDFAVDFRKDFLGRQAVGAVRESGAPAKRVGLVLHAEDDKAAGGLSYRLPPVPEAAGIASGRPARSGAPGAGPERRCLSPYLPPVWDAAGHPAGAITSATFSPTLGKAIAMAYVAPEAAKAGTELRVDTPAGKRPAEVVKLPFCRGTARA